MEIVQAVKKLNSISRERLNFRRQPILCTTLYGNPIQASNFGGTFDQLFLIPYSFPFKYRRSSSSFFVYFILTSFLFQSLSTSCCQCGLSPSPHDVWAGKAKRQWQGLRWYVVRPPCSWSCPRGRIVVVTPTTPSATITCCSTSFENRGRERPWFFAQVFLLPSNINAWSHSRRSWSQCERKILTGIYNNN